MPRLPSMMPRRGITLIEALIYVAILGVIVVFISNSLLYIVNTYQRARAEREVLSNARLMLETITKVIAQASEVYTATSALETDAGQLSLIISGAGLAGHEATYTDFYLGSGRLLVREEGKGEQPISAASVRVGVLRFERIVQRLGQEAVKVTLRIDSASARFPASVTLHATTALRGSY